MTVAVWPSALFLLTLAHGAGWTRPFAALRLPAAIAVVVAALPWLFELTALSVRAGLFLVPVLGLVTALSYGPAWPRWLSADMLLGCASGLTALLLATGMAGAADTLFQQLGGAVRPGEDTAATQALVRSLLAGLALGAVFLLLMRAIRDGRAGNAPGPLAVVHGAVVAAGLAAVGEGLAQLTAFWTVLAAHVWAAGPLRSRSRTGPSVASAGPLRVLRALSVPVVGFVVLEQMS